jgi:FtsH-binding integral membrane protein
VTLERDPSADPSRPATTTSEQDLRSAESRDQFAKRTAGQRRINIVWEVTQALLAISVVESALYVAVSLSLGSDGNVRQTALVMIVGLANLVTGFYFGRTNHARIGDVPKADGLDDR